MTEIITDEKILSRRLYDLLAKNGIIDCSGDEPFEHTATEFVAPYVTRITELETAVRTENEFYKQSVHREGELRGMLETVLARESDRVAALESKIARQREQLSTSMALTDDAQSLAASMISERDKLRDALTKFFRVMDSSTNLSTIGHAIANLREAASK